jgi:hypothetical protein
MKNINNPKATKNCCFTPQVNNLPIIGIMNAVVSAALSLLTRL